MPSKQARFVRSLVRQIALMVCVSMWLIVPESGAQGIKDAVNSELKDDGQRASNPDAEDQALLGLFDDGVYRSPQHGNDVTWGATWSADPLTMESNTNQSLDRLSLATDVARFQVFFVGAEGETADEYMTRFVRYRIAEDTTVAIVARDADNGVEWIAYTTAGQGDLVLHLIEIQLVDRDRTPQIGELIAGSDEFDQSFKDAIREIEVASLPPFVIVECWPE